MIAGALRRSLPMAAATLLVALAPAAAEAFCRRVAIPKTDGRDAIAQTPKQLGMCEFAKEDANPAYEYWPGRCVGFAVSLDGAARVAEDEAVGTVTRGLLRWSRSKCAGGAPTLEGHYLGRSTCFKSEFLEKGPNQNVIVFHGTWPYKSQDGADDDLKLGVTTTTSNTLTGEVLDADIEINIGAPTVAFVPEGVPNPGDYDLDAIVTHELGHALGLAHSLNQEATMWRSIAPGSIASRDLAPDDEAGFCFLYPPDGTRPRKSRGTPPEEPPVSVPATDCDVRPVGGFSRSCEAPSLTGCSLQGSAAGAGLLGGPFAACAAILLLRRRRR